MRQKRKNAVWRETRARRGAYDGALSSNDGGAVCAWIAGVRYPFKAPGAQLVISTLERSALRSSPALVSAQAPR